MDIKIKIKINIKTAGTKRETDGRDRICFTEQINIAITTLIR